MVMVVDGSNRALPAYAEPYTVGHLANLIMALSLSHGCEYDFSILIKPSQEKTIRVYRHAQEGVTCIASANGKDLDDLVQKVASKVVNML